MTVHVHHDSILFDLDTPGFGFNGNWSHRVPGALVVQSAAVSLIQSQLQSCSLSLLRLGTSKHQ